MLFIVEKFIDNNVAILSVSSYWKAVSLIVEPISFPFHMSIVTCFANTKATCLSIFVDLSLIFPGYVSIFELNRSCSNHIISNNDQLLTLFEITLCSLLFKPWHKIAVPISGHLSPVAPKLLTFTHILSKFIFLGILIRLFLLSFLNDQFLSCSALCANWNL